MNPIPPDRTLADAPLDDDAIARAARIAQLRRQIASGEYETPERMDGALEAFLDSDDAHRNDGEPPRRRMPR